MGPTSTRLLLPTALLALLAEVVAGQAQVTAIKKQVPDANEKLFPDHLGFAQLPRSEPFDVAELWLDDQYDAPDSNGTSKIYRPAFSLHRDESDESVLRRAAEALALLQKRQACPSGMSDCSSIGSANKCCPSGTYCAEVSDSTVGQIACCPNGATCGGSIGGCPGNAVSCAADLGGGCCIPGYVCQGQGCVSSVSVAPSSAPPPAPNPGTQTITSTKTTIVAGSPSTVVVTLTVSQTSNPPPTTETTIVTVTGSGTESATGVPAWLPTAPNTSATETDSAQTGCPTGFYGCLATHGGGCCRTDRDCNTFSCPATSTTVVSNGATIVVPVSAVPTAAASSTCAGGWFLCGKDAGPVAGCCPNGFQCGTASCFTTSASQTAEIQKSQPSAPSQNLAPATLNTKSWKVLGAVVGAYFLSSLL